LLTFHGKFSIDTKGENHIVDITGQVAEAIAGSGIWEGMALVFVAGSTAAITTLEFEPGLLEDLPAALERIAPAQGEYQHHLGWRDGNGHSHVRAALLGPGLTVPVNVGKPLLGTWQQIVLVELDVRPRERTVHVQVMGEK
jgi:secondary thiamine-phosphate synthase enzyme